MILPDLTGWRADPHSGCVLHAARQRGISVKRMMAPRTPGGPPEPWLSFSVGGCGYFYRQAILISNPDPRDSRQAHHVNRRLAHVTVDKYATKRLLGELGVPVPPGQRFLAGEIEKAEAMFLAMEGPACVKPTRAGEGRQVHPGLRDRQAFLDAFRAAGQVYGELVVEAHLEGENVRFFYVRPAVVGIRIDRPANVLGDGSATIADLLAVKNERRRRAVGLPPILLDRQARGYLARQGLDPGSRPEPGRRVFLGGISNPGTGGEGIDGRPLVHPSQQRWVEDFCGRLPELCLATLDIIIRDPAAPAAAGGQWVLEINSAPGITSYYFPWQGEPQDVAGKLIEQLMIEQW